MAIDIAKFSVGVLGAGVGGAAQRIAWENSEKVGMAVTAGLAIAGLAGGQMLRDPNLKNVTISGEGKNFLRRISFSLPAIIQIEQRSGQPVPG